MNKKKYMDRIDDYLRQELGGNFWISEMPVLTDCFPVSLWDRFLMFLGLKEEYLPVRIDWEKNGDRLHTIWSGPATDENLQYLATKFYSKWMNQQQETTRRLFESFYKREK